MGIFQKALFASALSAIAGLAFAGANFKQVQYKMEFKPATKEATTSPTIRTMEDQKAAITFWDASAKNSIGVEVTPKVSVNGIATLISFKAYGESFSTVLRGDFKMVFSTDKRGRLVADVASLSGKPMGHITLGMNTSLSGSSLVVHPSIVTEQP
jgi:hypothetical protein